MDYFEFEKYFKDKYKIKRDIWSMDDNAVVDYTGLEEDSKTLFYAKVGIDIDKNYDILNPEKFAEKIYNKLCDRYKEYVIKALFIEALTLGGKYPEIAKEAFMILEGTHGFDLYFTNKRITSRNKGLQCENFRISNISKEILSNLLNIYISNVYVYNDDNKIILIDCRNISYLTDLETLANYSKKSIKELYNILYKSELENNNILTEIVDELSNMGLVITDKKADDSNISVIFRYNDGSTGTFKYRYNRYVITKEIDDETKYLNELCHFVKNRVEIHTLDEAINILHRYISKYR